VANDPVSFLHRFDDPRDIETAGFVASQFAYGRVQQLMRFQTELFARMGASPYMFTASGDISLLGDLQYRFHKGAQIMRLFAVLRRIMERWGGIGSMIEHYYEGDFRQAVWAAREALMGPAGELLFFFPRFSPASPLKRWNLYARWMVRKDKIDFGLWHFIATRDLIVPLDANIFKIGRCLGWTDQRAQSWKAACQITDELKKHCPEDPLRYDFFLCHVIGIGSHCGGARNQRCVKGCLLDEI
jgi:uncharacterized protein (TIGR02757 family)